MAWKALAAHLPPTPDALFSWGICVPVWRLEGSLIQHGARAGNG